MAAAFVRLLVDEPLQLFLATPDRSRHLRVDYDGTSSLGHLVQSVGVPLTEVGQLLVDGATVEPSYRPQDGDVVRVRPVARPQPVPGSPAFVLDVHLGSLARRMRLLGLDTRYATMANDDELVQIALADNRVLLTKDRGLLRRRAMRRQAAYVRGERGDEQLADVLDRFAPPLAPYTRCPACNGILHPVAKGDVASSLMPGTVRCYQEFSRCAECGRVYWRGAHNRRLSSVVRAAVESVADPPALPSRPDDGPAGPP